MSTDNKKIRRLVDNRKVNVSAALEPGSAYWQRRNEVAAMAAGPGRPPQTVDYTAVEDEVWSEVSAALRSSWCEHASSEVVEGLARLGLAPDRVPQLAEVTARLEPLTGFRFEAVRGLVDTDVFFANLAHGRFLSTQYVRWEGSPLYTPEPDVIHEVHGHAHVLTCPEIADLHVLAGQAFDRLEAPAARQFVADVFWFSAEFGVVREESRWRAYGAGLLSSVGELAQFEDGATILPLDIAAMGTLAYDIDHYQPVLFGAASLAEVLEVVGGFYAACDDASIKALIDGASTTVGGPT